MKTQTVVLIILGVLIGLPVLACGGCLMLGMFAAAIAPPDPPTPDAPAVEAPFVDELDDADWVAPGATLAMFQQIQPGMPYEDVVAIAGEPSAMLSQMEIAGTRSSVFQWDGAAFASNMQITFTGGVVAAKAQFGLQ